MHNSLFLRALHLTHNFLSDSFAGYQHALARPFCARLGHAPLEIDPQGTRLGCPINSPTNQPYGMGHTTLPDWANRNNTVPQGISTVSRYIGTIFKTLSTLTDVYLPNLTVRVYLVVAPTWCI